MSFSTWVATGLGVLLVCSLAPSRWRLGRIPHGLSSVVLGSDEHPIFLKLIFFNSLETEKVRRQTRPLRHLHIANPS